MPASLRLHAASATFVSLALILALAVALAPTSAPATFAGKNGRIAFNGAVPGTCCSEIFTAKRNGRDIQRLTSTPGQSDSELPDWSPHGRGSPSTATAPTPTAARTSFRSMR